MHSSNKHDFQTAATQAGDESDFESELSILRDVFRLLPAGVTVQDEHGEFLLVNDAAAALLEMAAAAPSASQLSDRREPASNCCAPAARPCWRKPSPAARPSRSFSPRTGRSGSPDRNLLLSSSADITEQKAFEDHLFRSAYYDELTGLPTRRVIEHRVNSLLKRDGATRPLRAGLSRHRQFQAHQRLLRPRGRRRAAGGDRQAARPGPARIRHAVADQRRRIPAAAQSGPERAARSRNSSTSCCSG